MAFVDELITYIKFDTKLGPAKSAKKMMEQIASAGKALAVGLTGAATSVGYFANQTARAVAADKDFADSIGLSYSKMQDYQYALEKMGGSADEASGDLEKLQLMAMRQGKSIDEVLGDLAGAVKGQPNIGIKQLAQNFGLSEASIKLLQQGKEETLKTMGEMNKYGGKISEDSAKNSQKFVSEMNTLKRVISGSFKEAVAGALPEVTALINTAKEWIGANKEIIKSTISTFIKGVTQGFKEAFSALGSVVSVAKSVIGMFADIGGEGARVAVIATIVKYAVLALAIAMGTKFVAGAFSATKGLIQFGIYAKRSQKYIERLIRHTPALSSAFASMRSGLGSVALGWKSLLKNPKAAADVFAKSMLSGIKSVGSFAKSIFTVGIPAVAKFAWSMLKSAVAAAISFATTLFTVVIPAVWAFNVALFANPITWIVLGIVAAVAAVVAGVIYLWKWFSKLMNASGSLGTSLLVLGQTYMKALLMPINLVIDGIVSLLTLMSKIPLVGNKFKGVAEDIKEFQDATNKALTGDEHKYDLTSRTKQVIEKGKEDKEGVVSRATASATNNNVTPARGGGGMLQTNNAKMEQTIYINGAQNPNEVGRQVSSRTTNSLQSIAPGITAPLGGY